MKDARNQWTEYGYNEVGNLVSQEDANDHGTRYEYDGVGRRTATILPMNQRSTMTYDAVGNLHSITDFNGETTVYRYDERNWLIEQDFDDDPTVSMTYTRHGLVETITDGRGITQFEYDERDRLTKRIDPDGKWIAYGYDVAGNQTLVKTALGETRYTFDARNWLDTVIATDGITDYDYNAVGNLTHTDFGNGTQETRQYNDLNRLVYLENKEADGDLISSYSYTLDKIGNRLSVKENNGRKVNYTYDELYRLTQEQILDAVNGNRNSGYVYDNVGNRLTKTDSVEGTTTYTYDANDRLLQEKVNGQVTTTYTYDDNGNTLTKAEPGQETRYTWDGQNRLLKADIITAEGTKHLEYVYDTSGIRVASKVDGQETRYLIDTVQPYAQVLEEYTPDGTVLTAYVYGNDLISQTHYDPQTQVGSTTYYHVDGLGSTTALTDETGTVVSTSQYDAFGEKIGGTGMVENKYLFAGEQYDEGLGDYYLRARYYNTSTGRFTRRDTYEGNLDEPLTLHKYIYTHNNPVNGIDPTGFSMYSIADVSAAHAIVNDLIREYVTFAGRFVLNAAGIEVDEELAKLASVNPLAWFIQWKSTSGQFPGMMSVGSQPSPNMQSKIDGDAFLKAALETLGAQENYSKVPGSTRSGKTGNTEPDLLDAPDALLRQYDVTEIKDEKKISYSSQLQIQNDYARSTGKTHNLIIGPNTQSVSKQLQQEIRQTGGIIVKFDPQKRIFTKVTFDRRYPNRVL